MKQNPLCPIWIIVSYGSDELFCKCKNVQMPCLQKMTVYM